MAAEIKMVAEAFRSAARAVREADDEKLAQMRAMRTELTPRQAAIVKAFCAVVQELYREIGKTEREMVDARVRLARELTDFYEEQNTEWLLLQSLLSKGKAIDDERERTGLGS